MQKRADSAERDETFTRSSLRGSGGPCCESRAVIWKRRANGSGGLIPCGEAGNQ